MLKLVTAMLAVCIVAILCEPVWAQYPETKPKSDVWNYQENSSSSHKVSGIEFFGGVNAGLAKAKAVEKPLFVYMKKQSCQHCVKFEKRILINPDVKKFLGQNFVCARVLSNTKDAKILECEFGCHAYPHFVLFRNNGKLKTRWYGLPNDSSSFLKTAKHKLAESKKTNIK